MQQQDMENPMDANVKQVMQDCSKGSDEDGMRFPEVIGRLMAAGVERYHADLCRAEKTYYLPNGESHIVPSARIACDPAPDFAATRVEATVRAIQAGKLGYQEFCAEIMAAGCVGYCVSLAGRRAVYYGRTGDCYVEPFPPAS
jgi:uncharacterized protein YbcV (DUF1398 family)